MATISGTIRGVTQVSRAFMGAGSTTTRDAREVWLMTVDFGAYTGASDTAQVQALGAAITATARDGRTRTLRGVGPAFAGADANNQACYFTGTAVQAGTISSDDSTGQL